MPDKEPKSGRGRPRSLPQRLRTMGDRELPDVLSGADWMRDVSVVHFSMAGTPDYSPTFHKEWKAVVRTARRLGDVVIRAEAAGMVDSSAIKPDDPTPDSLEETWVWLWRRLMTDAQDLVAARRPIQHKASLQLRESIAVVVDADPPQDRVEAEVALRERRRRAKGGPELVPLGPSGRVVAG